MRIPIRIAALALAALWVATGSLAAPQKVLRVPFIIAETNFDPARVSDLYSNTVVEEIFEAPLSYDPLATPATLRPQLLESMPEVSDGGRTYLLRFRKGIYFADDPVFKGARRELTAQDFAYGIRRLIDPRNASPNLWMVEGRIEGIDEATLAARKAGTLDYEAPIRGIALLDRYTMRIRLAKPDYNFLYILAIPNLAAQAREVVEFYGNDVGAHPVGTGPYLLREWKRSSKIVLEKNPNFRDEVYDAHPAEGDALSQRLYAEMKGKKIPQIDRVEIYPIEESQPRWLAFLNNELDWINLPYEFNSMAIPGGKLAPYLAKRGVKHMPGIEADLTYTYFNMKDPMVGGYTPDRVALRRAISLAYDNEEDVQLIRNGTAMEAQGPIPPGVLGYDPDFYIGPSHDTARAKALLDMFGYIDRDGDGWREMPDGSPLVYTFAADPSQLTRLFTQLWKKSLDSVGIRMEVLTEKWPDLRKKSKLGKLQSWFLSWGADYPDGENFLQLLYGPNCGSSNDGCFQLAEFDKLYEEAAALPPGTERTKIYQKMSRLVVVYAPMKLSTHRKRNQMVQPWVIGWRKHPIMHDGYRYADIDLEVRERSLK
jgi:oligopeptide transport system substrate-binding protein